MEINEFTNDSLNELLNELSEEKNNFSSWWFQHELLKL